MEIVYFFWVEITAKVKVACVFFQISKLQLKFGKKINSQIVPLKKIVVCGIFELILGGPKK